MSLPYRQGFSKPKTNFLGVEFAGIVESVGKEVYYFQKGDKVFGTVTGLKKGTYAVQIAKYFGAKVTAVCSGKNIQLVRSIGADEAIDYTIQKDGLSNEQYDIVFDAVGKMPQSFIKPILKPFGTFCSINTLTEEMLSSVIN